VPNLSDVNFRPTSTPTGSPESRSSVGTLVLVARGPSGASLSR